MLVEQATGNQFAARPSSVFAPVLASSCSQQRPFLLLAGPLARGNPTCLRKASLTLQSAPKHVSRPIWKLPFAIIRATPLMGYHFTVNFWHCETRRGKCVANNCWLRWQDDALLSISRSFRQLVGVTKLPLAWSTGVSGLGK